MTVPASALRWPVEIPITPRSPDDDSARFEVVVQALEDGRVLAETRAITAFKPKAHRTLKVRLFGCPGQAPGYTCAELDCQGEGCKVCAANGECVSVTQIDPTLRGAVVSDALEDGQVVSGVGGQFDFAAQSFALEDARFIIAAAGISADEAVANRVLTFQDRDSASVLLDEARLHFDLRTLAQHHPDSRIGDAAEVSAL